MSDGLRIRQVISAPGLTAVYETDGVEHSSPAILVVIGAYDDRIEAWDIDATGVAAPCTEVANFVRLEWASDVGTSDTP